MDQKSLSPEQQKQFNLVARQALEHLLADDSVKLILSKAKGGDAKQAVIDAVTPVMQGIWSAAQNSGVQLDAAVFLAAGIQVLTVLAEMLSLFGIVPKEQIQQFAAEVAKQAVAQHNERVQQPPQGQAPQEEQPQQPAPAGGM